RVGDREHSFCPNCNEILLRRRGFYVLENRMAGNKCHNCGTVIPGVWETDPPRQSLGTGYPMPVQV
ncbi:MAG: AmmeMemoRadiSam system radical SAM enzyme, partial [Phycisphaerae bacterium]|nr:AmmeMemoRadiSam system radical SAM enzyme [Phycisphaerae bacterium]